MKTTNRLRQTIQTMVRDAMKDGDQFEGEEFKYLDWHTDLVLKTCATYTYQQVMGALHGVESQVIGDDEVLSGSEVVESGRIYRNKLRAEQRKALSNIKQEYESSP